MRALNLWLILALAYTGGVNAGLQWEASNFCKCKCFQNSTILPLYLPTSASKPCLTCTKQWCLEQKISFCLNATLGDTSPDVATGKEGDVEARCFQRDSPRDQLIVTLFILLVFGLLLGAGIKRRMEKAGFHGVDAWRGTRRWWEALLPTRQPDAVALTTRRPRPSFGGSRRGEYVAVQAEPSSEGGV